MRLNLMTDYAIRTIKVIYEHTGVVTSKIISEKQCIPHGVLMKVLRKLRMHDIIRSHQGRGEVAGGYSLHDNVGKLTLLNVIEVMEGPVELSFLSRAKEQELSDPASEQARRAGYHGIEMEYQRITEILRKEMDRYTISELLKR